LFYTQILLNPAAMQTEKSPPARHWQQVAKAMLQLIEKKA
jgi:hypothetical protein